MARLPASTQDTGTGRDQLPLLLSHRSDCGRASGAGAGTGPDHRQCCGGTQGGTAGHDAGPVGLRRRQGTGRVRPGARPAHHRHLPRTVRLAMIHISATYADEQLQASHEREQDAINALPADLSAETAQVYATLALVAAVRSLRETVNDLCRQLP